MRPFVLAALLIACSAQPPIDPPGPDAGPDAPDLCAAAGRECACSGAFAFGRLVCRSGVVICEGCPTPDAATPDAPTDAVAVADAAPDAPLVPDAPSPPDASVAVPDAPSADAPTDVAPDRYNCSTLEPRCRTHADCAICLPTATGTAWCCNPMNGYCRATLDRSSCE